MKFYIPMKPHKWGFKIHLLCDSNTKYLYNMLFDPGKDWKDFIYYENNKTITESIVLRLLKPLNDGKKKKYFFDGWNSSIGLLNKLSNQGYLNITVLKNNAKDQLTILIQKYEDEKNIYFATNYYIDIDKLRNIYNIKDRGVDIFDLIL